MTSGEDVPATLEPSATAELFAAAFDAIPEGFVLCGARGEVVRMNGAAQRLLDFSPAERAMPSAECWARRRIANDEGEPLGYDESPLARALAGETVRGAHLRIEAPGGSAWVLVRAAPIRAPDGIVLGAVLTISDENAVHALEDARDDLVRMISHDLRTPLNAVLAQAHMLRRAPGDAAKVEERASSIARSCDRMSAMIEDLLHATLLEAGQLKLSLRPVDLAKLVQEVIARNGGALAVERVAVSVRGTLPPIHGDPERLERVVVNLVSNALKYSPPQGGVAVEIAPADGGAQLTVTDHGVGIAPEDLTHVFERFFRARGARQPEGLGLGLYITRLLVRAHGGRIDVQSRLGQGSTFQVFLPAEGPLRAPTEAP